MSLKKSKTFSNTDRIDTTQFEKKLINCGCKPSKQCEMDQCGVTETWRSGYLRASEQKMNSCLCGWRTDAHPNSRGQRGQSSRDSVAFMDVFSVGSHGKTTLESLQVCSGWDSERFLLTLFFFTTHIATHLCYLLINWFLMKDRLWILLLISIYFSNVFMN